MIIARRLGYVLLLWPVSVLAQDVGPISIEGGMIFESRIIPPPETVGQILPAGAGVTFTITFDDAGGVYADYHDTIETVLAAAAEAWGRYLDGNAVIELLVDFDAMPDVLAFAGPTVGINEGQFVDGFQVFTAGTIWEIAGQGDPNGSEADGMITINPEFFDSFTFYPDPVEPFKYDLYSVLVHELGHVLGFSGHAGYYSGEGPYATTFDINAVPDGTGGFFFDGVTSMPLHEATKGTPLRLADSDPPTGTPVHLGISDEMLDDLERGLFAAAGTLMYHTSYPGLRYDVSKLEIAVLADSGMPIAMPCPEVASFDVTDGDADGIADCEDNCPDKPNADQTDSDGDGVGDDCDGCPSNPDLQSPVDGSCDCSEGADADGDGVLNCDDQCPGAADVDSDGDGTMDCIDACPDDPGKTAPGTCGCGLPDDQGGDASDLCPCDPEKDVPGPCGCGEPDTDSDGDGTADCIDECPEDGAKTSEGDCGCAVPDDDTDGDGVSDCLDGCPDDSGKTDAGVCGCGVADTDADGDGTADCVDGCPSDAGKTAPGECGCGAADIDLFGDGTITCAGPGGSVDDDELSLEIIDGDDSGSGDGSLPGVAPSPPVGGVCGAGMISLLWAVGGLFAFMRAARRRRSRR